MPRARTLEERIDEIRPEHATRASTLGDRHRPGIRSFWGVLPVLAIIALLALRAVLHTDPLDRLAPAPSDPRDPPATTAYTGSLAITRGGPVKLGFQSATPARLVFGGDLTPPEPHHALRVGMSVDEARRVAPALASAPPLPDGRIPLVKNAQVTTLVTLTASRITLLEVELRGHSAANHIPAVERAILRSGAVAIRFAAPEGARLVWNPVGRRGDTEYVPASSLAPAPPATATFDTPGTSRLDGTIALAILAVIVATLVGLARRRLAAVSRDTWIAMGGVLAVAFAVRFLTLGDQGQTWDEDVNWAAGRNYVTNLLALDFSERSWVWNYEHPPIMKYLTGIGAQLADGFTPARTLSALWSSLACALLVPIGTRLYRFRVGVAAGAIAALLPTLVAHGQIVGHESPTTLWWTFGILLALGAHDYLPADDRRATRTLQIRLAWIGVVVGIAVASRFVNGLLGPLCVLIVLVQAPERWRRATLGWAVLMPIAAVLAFYLVWPRLWLSPIASLSAALAKLDTLHAAEPFLGAVTAKPGPHYFLVYLVATLPAGVAAALLAWIARAMLDVRARVWRPTVITLAWFLIPLVGIMLSPVRQDGVRYVMPCILAFAVAAAAGVDAIARWVKRERVFHAAAAAMIAYLVVVDIRTSPYYLDYFGEHIGSAGDVTRQRAFEVAWWGEGLDRALAYVNEHAEPDAIVVRCIDPAHLAWFREDLWRPARAPTDATWFVVYAPATRSCGLPPDARVVYEVTHDGATLAAVYRR